MDAKTELTFAATCGAALAPGAVSSETDAPLVVDQTRLTALIYGTCADWLSTRIEAGEAVSTALARWIAEAGTVLAAYRGARSNYVLIERKLAWAAPRAVLEAIAHKVKGGAPDISAIAAAPVAGGPVSRMIAQCALSQSPRARDLDAELNACSLVVTLNDEEQARQAETGLIGAEDLDDLAAEIHRKVPSTEAYAALQAEVSALRDMLDHAQGRKIADIARLDEQVRKIETQHSIIRTLERELGEARGAVRQVQSWMKGGLAI